MTTTSAQPAPLPAGASGPVGPDGERIRIRGPLRRLLIWLAPANFAIYVLWGAIPSVLLPIQVAAVDEAGKVANLAVVSTIGAFAAMIAQPIAGALSDRTRSRFGRRAPWMVAGALVGGLALIGMSLANGIVQIVIAWTCVQIAFNFAQGPLTAILPDRVPRAVRGTFAAVAGLAMMFGAVGGQVLGAAFAEAIGVGYVLLAGIALVAITLFVVVNREAPSTDAPRERFVLLDFVRTFWVNPIAHPDFFWAFTGRFLLYVAYFGVTAYNLYLLQDYIGLGDEAPGFVALLALTGLLAMLPAIGVSGPLSDRLGRRKIFVFASSVIVGLGLVVPWFVPTITGMFVMAALMGLGFGAFQAVDQALITEVLPDAKDYAKDLGVVNIAATLPQTIAPALAGAIVWFFGFGALFPVGIVLAVLGALAVFLIKSVR